MINQKVLNANALNTILKELRFKLIINLFINIKPKIMTRKKHITDAQMLEDYEVALVNVETQPTLSSIMAQYTYDSAKIAVGKSILANTRSKFNFNNIEDSQTFEAKVATDEKKMAVIDEFKLNRKKAKVVFLNNPVAIEKLGLAGKFPTRYVNVLEAMSKFYGGIQSNTEYQEKLTPLKLTPEVVTQALTSIDELKALRKEYLREVGESQDATKAKDAAFAELEKWMQDFYAVARIAMDDQPQLLESIGLLVRS